MAERQEGYVEQQFKYGTSTNVTEEMMKAGARGEGISGRVKAGVSAAFRQKTRSMYGDATTTEARFMRLLGMDTAAKWYDRFFGLPKGKQKDSRRTGRMGEEKESGGMGAMKTAIKIQNMKLNVIHGLLDVVSKDVVDIKTMLSPKAFTAKSGDDRQFVQYNPLAPQGEQFRQISDTGMLKATKPDNKFMKSAFMKAAYMGARQALDIKEAEDERQKLREKFKFKEAKEKFKVEDPVTKLEKSMKKEFQRLHDRLDKGEEEGWGWMDMLKLGGSALAAKLAAAAAAVASAASTMLIIDKGMKQVADTEIDKIMLSEERKVKETGETGEYDRAIEKALQTAESKLADAKKSGDKDRTKQAEKELEYIKWRLQNSEKLSQEQRDHAKKYLEEREKSTGKISPVEWREMEDSVIDKLSKAHKSKLMTREEVETVLDSWDAYKKSAQAGEISYPSTEDFFAKNPIPEPKPVPEAPVELRKEPATEQPAPKPKKETTELSMKEKEKNLLEVIAKGEGTSDAEARARGYESGYDVTLGYGKYHHPLMKPLSKMTLREVRALQTEMLKHPQNKKDHGKPSSAVGKYQIVRTTLFGEASNKDYPRAGLVGQLGLDDSDIFSPELQDRLGSYLLKGRGLNKLIKGEISSEDYQRELAKEWDSVEVPGKGKSHTGGPARTKTGDIQPVISALGAPMDKESRTMTAATQSAPSSTVVAPTVVNSPTIASTAPRRPMDRADGFSGDDSFVRSAARDVKHPAIG